MKKYANRLIPMRYQYFQIENLSAPVDTIFRMEVQPGAPEVRPDLILPDGTPGLLWVEEGGFFRYHGEQAQYLTAGRFYLFGQKTRAVRYRFGEAPLRACGVKLRPAGLYALFGLPAHALTDGVLSLAELDGIIGKQVRALEASDGSGALKLERLLSKLVRTERVKNAAKAEMLPVLLSDIHRSGGRLSVQSLSQKYQLGYKSLERLFREYVGLTPKLYARIIRLNHSLSDAARTTAPRLTDVAYRHGFFDQMHFIKEVRKFTGEAPSRLLGRPDSPLEENQMRYLSRRGY